MDGDIELEESWFQLAPEGGLPCSLEVPQLWNEKRHSKLQVSGKSIRAERNGKGTHTHGVYGGVNFGLDKFNLRTSVAATRGLKAGLAASISAGKPPSRLPPGPGRPAHAFAGVSALPRLATSGAAGLPRLAPSVATGQSLDLSYRPAGAAVQMVSPGTLAGVVPARGVVPAAQQLARMASLLPRSTPSVAIPGSLTAYGRQFTPPGMSGIAPPRMPAFLPPNASLSAVSAPRLSPSALAAAFGTPRLAGLTAPFAPPAPMSIAAAQALGAGLPSAPSLQGVDLRLDNFDLSSAKRVSTETNAGSWATDVRPLDECMVLGETFWWSLESDCKVFQADDHDLLNSIFNPELSDRRAEGDLFCPPDASHSYVTTLRTLVKQEESLRHQRTEQFLDTTFLMSEPGPAFPASWTSSMAVARGSVPVRSLDLRPRGALITRPEYKDHAAKLLEGNLRISTPVFDKSTEEGMRFRIYSLGSLEVRTTQELGCEEVVGAVFSIRNTESASLRDEGGRQTVSMQEKIVHATEFVERIFLLGEKPSALRRYYLVLETENGHMIVTERLPDGRVTWEEDPEELEDRNSLAKATRSSACCPDLRVQDLKTYQATVARGAAQAGVASPSVCKRYGRSAYARAVGSESRRGFISPPWWMDIAKQKMEAKQEEEAKKKDNFISLPHSMLKKI